VRASTRRRITLALIGLLVIVLLGWFVQEAAAVDTGAGAMSVDHWQVVTSLPQQQDWILSSIPTSNR